jgi:phenylalanyl-tRNA synthetase beta chain
MRVSLAWLAEWIELPASVETLVERLTLAGLEIESVERQGPDLSSFVVGEVRERQAHPDASRLSVCQVDLGDGALHTIVCGAPNVAAGQKVAVIRPGSALPDGTLVKRAKLRGIESAGMICSARELGLSDEHEGILVLDPGARVGAPLAEALGGADTVLDVEITPNRGDWASMLGIAREVRAQFGGQLALPPCDVVERGAPAKDSAAVAIEDAQGCYHYAARVVRGVQVGPSPRWLERKLAAAGMRSINVVVDVTNLVLLELGQPLHAFDLARLDGGEVRVRSARAGESLTTLDGTSRALAAGDLVIADAQQPVALAGVMGGAGSEVQAHTRDVLIESAHFAAARVRATARRHGLRTEASYRFERGVDRAGVQRAADRAARLLAELAGGAVAAGTLEAHGVPAPAVSSIALDPERPNRLLGTRFDVAELSGLLARVDVAVESRGPQGLVCRIPSYRNDLAIAEDLVEEVARAHGYDRIPTTLPVQPLATVSRPPRHRLAQRARDALCGAGLIETTGFPSLEREDLDRLRIPAQAPQRRLVELLNPFTDAEGRLRTTLLPGLLRAAQRNLARQVERVRLFEVGPIFQGRAGGELPDERLCAAFVLAGQEGGGLWDARSVPIFFRARGAIERLAADLGFSPVFGARGSGSPALHPGASLDVSVEEHLLGSVGELHPEVASAFAIDVPCAVAELDLTALLERALEARTVRAVSRFPLVRRDVAVLLERSAPASEVCEAIRKAAGEHVIDVHVFDRYEGRGIPAEKVSLAFRMVFQHPERTLRDDEIARATERVRKMLVHRFRGELR